jgi:hypothetical protein
MQPGGVLEGTGGTAGSRRGFFSTPAGIAVIALGLGGAGYGIYELTKQESEASPIR